MAVSLARMSTCNKKHGALIERNGNVLAVGVNKLRNNPKQTGNPYSGLSIHAEEQAIKACKGDTNGATMYVARVRNADGLPGYSKPCGRCQEALHDAGIHDVIYTGDLSETFIMEVE